MTARLSCFATILLIAFAMSAQSLRGELVHYYTFDIDTFDDPLVNDSGNGAPLHGMRTPALTLTSGRTGDPNDQALLFQAIGFLEPEYVRFDDYEFTDDFSIAAWVRPEPLTENILTIVANKNRGGPRGDGFHFHINNWKGSTLGNIALEVGNGQSQRQGTGFITTPAETVSRLGETWQQVAITVDRALGEARLYYNGEESTNSPPPILTDFNTFGPWRIGSLAIPTDDGAFMFHGAIDEVAIWDETLSSDQILNVFELGAPGYSGFVPGVVNAGDANMDLKFDQLDLVQVQIAAKYLTGEPATWGEGDWDGAPGGSPGNPPLGDGVFGQLDIIAALASGVYLTGPYAALESNGVQRDGQTSIVYHANTGELAVDSPAGTELTSINIDSAAGIFRGEAAQSLGGSFDNDADNNVFKATFGGSFGSLSFGNVAQPGLAEDFVLGDLTVIGSLHGGGALGDVDLIYVPEPCSVAMLLLGLVSAFGARRRPPV